MAVAEYGKDMRVTTDKVSDALGLMWWRGYLKRFPAPQTSKTLARFAYLWDDKVSKPVALFLSLRGRPARLRATSNNGAQRLCSQ